VSDGASAVDPGSTAGPTALRVLLGLRLRRLREARGISAHDAALTISGSDSKISRIELGRSAVREVDVMDLLGMYGVTDHAERDGLLALARQANQPAWWHDHQDVLPAWFQLYIGLEQSAQCVGSYAAQFVPDLLQTEDYAAALIRLSDRYSDKQASQRVEILMQRQRRLIDDLQLWSVIDEAALRRWVGSSQLMRAQLEHLLEMGSRPGVTVQVAPLFTSAACAPPCSFTILHFKADELPDTVYVEQFTSAQYLDKPFEVERYAAVMEQLRSVSTRAEQTTGMIQKILADIGLPP
jgi:transcriptional regulator with XRE-family HTH domain